jgi:hypothetical protein
MALASHICTPESKLEYLLIVSCKLVFLLGGESVWRGFMSRRRFM